MSGLPEITVAGTVVADPTIKYLDSGAAVATFTIAANDRRFDRERGEWVDASATFLRCSIWRREAEHVTESLAQGDRVLATGVLKQNKWETEQGEKRTAFELAVSEIGASLKFATARISKARRTTPSESGSGEGVPAGVGTTAADEPPF
jgi:single-strand DNA-binding protein